MGGPGKYQIVVQGSGWSKAGTLKDAVDKKAGELCGSDKFWAKYTMWGATRKVYTASVDFDSPIKEMYGSISCNAPFEQNNTSNATQ